MLRVIGVDSVEELYSSVPPALRLNTDLDLPPALSAEVELARHVNGVLAKNATAATNLSFLGHGCYQHHVPAICGEVNTRAEFLTAYAGEPYEDHGKWQAIFEYTSVMAELLEMDVVTVPTYDGFQASATAIRMALRITGRRQVLLSSALLPDKRAKILAYLRGFCDVIDVPADPATGRMDAEWLAERMDADVACVFIETPNVFGVAETEMARIAALAHAQGAIVITSVDPISLGYLEAPANTGSDIVCGDIQSLGLGMHYGGANGGFLAIHDDERFVFELPSRLYGLAPTAVEGEIGFTDVAYERTSLAMREEGVEWVGTAAALWGITAAVYLSAMGPQGMAELGTTVAANTRYAIERLSLIPGVSVPFAASAHWREFVLRFEGITASEVSDRLRARGIFGGVPLTSAFPDLGEASVWSVTEIHTAHDIDRLVDELKEIMR